MMLTIFDQLSAYLQESKKPQTYCNWFLVNDATQLIKKGMDLGSSPPKHAKLSLKIFRSCHFSGDVTFNISSLH